MENLTVESSNPVTRSLVNPIAVKDCTVRVGEGVAPILDISYVRLVVARETNQEVLGSIDTFPMEFQLERHTFAARVKKLVEGEGWIRYGFEKIVPSAQAHLRSFLSPKKVGESIVEDWRTDEMRHYHGLNESELWFHSNGGVIFTYLDSYDGNTQFMIRLIEGEGPLKVGRVTRKDYMEMNSLDAEVPLVPLSDREVYARLGECRDIITNFRPIGQLEYHLKQRLLKLVSETLYSTSRRVEMNPIRPTRSANLDA